MAPQRSRADAMPLTWEIPATLAGCWLLLALAFLPAGQGAAGWLFAGGFTYPDGQSALVESVTGLLTGQPGRGLTPADAEHVASTPLTYLLIALGELALIALTGWGIALWWRTLGPGAHHGMATRTEVEAVLGMSNLRKKRKVIRPDRYARGNRIQVGS